MSKKLSKNELEAIKANVQTLKEAGFEDMGLAAKLLEHIAALEERKALVSFECHAGTDISWDALEIDNSEEDDTDGVTVEIYVPKRASAFHQLGGANCPKNVRVEILAEEPCQP
jgi:hypothetical protein